MPLKIVQTDHAGSPVLAVDGDLDLVTAPLLADAAIALADSGQHDIVIDATALQFCDSSGLTAFVRIANHLAPDGRLAVVAPQPIVLRVLDVSGLTEAFVVTDTVADALRVLATATR
ncbi:MAG TPA: STAS domain-containing protein [Micromonosporaceae bacterium]|jgi:anti-anti-sigma factor